MKSVVIDSLNAEQREAVLAEGHVSVIACPGSGKTRVLEHRAARLLNNPESKVVAVTFTRDAAKELEQRIKRQISRANAKRLRVGTFHSFALNQIKPGLGNKTLINEALRHQFIAASIEASGVQCSLEEGVKYVEYFKSTLYPSIKTGNAYAVFKWYNDILNKNNGIDFHDIMLFSVKMMHTGKISPLPGTHMLVDEFQDTDDTQYAWMKAHSGHMHITVVGDDDQSIYGWRNARGFKGMKTFEYEHHARRIVLQTNYRCRSEILNAANRLIVNNKSRQDKRLHAAKGPGGNITTYYFIDPEQESKQVIRNVHKNPDSWAILSRTNRQLDVIEKDLRSHDIPFYRSSMSFLKKPHVVAYLDFVQAFYTNTNMGFEHALYYAGTTQHDCSTLLKICGGSYFNGLSKKPNLALINAETRTKIKKIANKVNAWRTASRKKMHAIILKGIADWLQEMVKTDNQRYDIDLAKKLVTPKTPGMSRDHILQKINNLRHVRQKKTTEGVKLYTLHGCKGLEFPNVWIIGCDTKTLPLSREGHIGDVEEERRLLYVGITRAMELLHISYAGSKAEPSRFLDEFHEGQDYSTSLARASSI